MFFEQDVGLDTLIFNDINTNYYRFSVQSLNLIFIISDSSRIISYKSHKTPTQYLLCYKNTNELIYRKVAIFDLSESQLFDNEIRTLAIASQI